MRIVLPFLTPILGWLVVPVIIVLVGVSPTPLGVGWKTQGVVIELPPDAQGDMRHLFVHEVWRWRWGGKTENLDFAFLPFFEGGDTPRSLQLALTPDQGPIIRVAGSPPAPEQEEPLSAEIMADFLARIVPDLPESTVQTLSVDVLQFLTDLADSGSSVSYFDKVANGTITVDETQLNPNGYGKPHDTRVLVGATWIDAWGSYHSIGPESWATPFLKAAIILSLVLTPIVEIRLVRHFRKQARQSRKETNQST